MMAERLAEVSAQIQNVHQLESVVVAMRGIAASRTQRARSLLPGINAYSSVVSRAIGQALSLMPADYPRAMKPARDRLGLILFCAEQGFAGAFSQRVLDDASADLARATTFVIGTRGLVAARERGLEPSWTAPMATHVDAVALLASDIADALYERFVDAALSEVRMIVPRSTSAGGIHIERRSLLPLDLTSFQGQTRSQPPLTTLSPDVLLERLTAEYVYARLCEAAMHTYEAENQARMMTMTAARNNIETRLAGLAQREQQLRQEEITNEIIELAAGAEASRGNH
jgi:F-type H+-transporting ATPase subunit gamma